jgi:hypothetical protein
MVHFLNKVVFRKLHKSKVSLAKADLCGFFNQDKYLDTISKRA